MPKLPRNMVKRGRVYYFRQMVGGRRVRRSLGSDYDEACRKVRLFKKEGTTLPSSITVEAAAKQWLDLYVATARNEKGQGLAEHRVGAYLNAHLGPVMLSKLSGERLRGYRLWLERQSLSVQSVKHVLSDARCFLRWCEDTGRLERSPWPRRIMPRIQERPPDRLTEEELQAVCAAPSHVGFVVRLAAGTGLRWGELCRLQSTDLQNGCLVVHRTKSGKVRRVPVPDELLRELKGRVGKLVPYSAKSSGAFATVVQNHSGVKRFHVHQLRHTFACRWLEVGGSLAALQELLGHSTLVTTQRYARLGEDHVQAEAKRIQGRLATLVATPAKEQSA